MYSTVASANVNRAQSVSPICQLFAKTFRSQQGNNKMNRRKANSVSSCDSQASTSSTSIQGKMPWNVTSVTKTRQNNRAGNIDKELEVLASELLPRVLRMPFTVEQWMNAIYSVCDQYGTDCSGDDYSEKDCYQRKRPSYPEPPKLPMIGLSSMEKRLRDPNAKLCPNKTAPLPPAPQQEITVRVPDPMNLPIMWVPKLPPQTAQLLQAMPCEIFQDIHRNCKQVPDKQPPAPRKKCPSPRRKSPQRKPLSKPAPKSRPRQRSRRKRRRQCCCCCHMTRQEMGCAGMGAGPGPAYQSPSRSATAPSPSKATFKSKPAPKPKPKPKPKAKPAAKKAEESEKAAEKEEAPKVEVKLEEAKPAPTKPAADSSSDDSSSDDSAPPTPAVPAAPAAPPGGGNDFMSNLFASSPAPSGASSPKPAGGADWMSDFGGASSPKPPAAPASAGMDWLTGGASPAAPKSTSPGADWLS